MKLQWTESIARPLLRAAGRIVMLGMERSAARRDVISAVAISLPQRRRRWRGRGTFSILQLRSLSASVGRQFPVTRPPGSAPLAPTKKTAAALRRTLASGRGARSPAARRGPDPNFAHRMTFRDALRATARKAQWHQAAHPNKQPMLWR